MGEGNLKEFDLVLAGEEALRPAIERERAEMLAATAEQLREEMAPHLSPTDSDGAHGRSRRVFPLRT